jgi:hypothetical protein
MQPFEEYKMRGFVNTRKGMFSFRTISDLLNKRTNERASNKGWRKLDKNRHDTYCSHLVKIIK